MSYASPQSSSGAARSATDASPRVATAARCVRSSSIAFETVRFATTSSAGRAASSGPSADQQDAGPAQRHAGVALDVAQQARAIGVVAEPDAAVAAQRIAGAGDLATFGANGGEPERIELERQRHVAPAAAAVGEGLQGRLEGVERALQTTVFHRLAGLLRERRMDERRLAVGNRVAHHDIAVHQGGAAPTVASRPSSRVNLKREVITS
jgi:hypothetical protein